MPFFSWNVKCWFYFPWTVKGPNYFPWNVIFTLLPPVLFHPQCKTSFSFGLVMIHRWTQLFRVRLSYERGRAYATMSKVIIGNGGFTVALLNLRCFSVVEGNSTSRCIHAFSFMSFLVAESPWNSSKAKLLLPIIPIGIVAYAFTVLWDNLCRNSCIPTCSVRISRLL